MPSSMLVLLDGIDRETDKTMDRIADDTELTAGELRAAAVRMRVSLGTVTLSASKSIQQVNNLLAEVIAHREPVPALGEVWQDAAGVLWRCSSSPRVMWKCFGRDGEFSADYPARPIVRRLDAAGKPVMEGKGA